jgi:exodeoxyribonuclease V alpha subunit
VLIVDEMSMVDILLFYSLLKAVKSGTRLIMVGDSDQLPSVGPGDVLRNIISSKAVHTVALSEIFRQAQESMIVVNAHRINSGKLPLLNQNGSDFFMVKRDSGQDILNTVVDLCKTRLPNKYGYNPITQIQVLTPTRKGIAGVAALNESLQQALNPRHKSKKEIKYKATTFREGDKVMQIKNNYEMQWNSLGDASEGIGVFNGDVGYIEKINPEEEYITVVFDDRRVVYSFSQLDELELAYAVTVHKSQGSEFEAVVMPMYPAPPMLLSRNLFYTAVTRAKKLVVLVGRESIVEKMVENASESKRYSLLKNRLGG